MTFRLATVVAFCLTFLTTTYSQHPTSSYSKGTAAQMTQAPTLWPVPTGSRWGYIDRTGQLVSHQQFNSAGVFNEGLAAVGDGSRFGYIDPSGRVLIPFQYEDAGFFHDGVACVKLDGKWGFINESGQMVISPRFDQQTEFHSGFAELPIAFQDRQTKANFFDHSGRVVWQPSTMDQTVEYNDGHAWQGKMGIDQLRHLPQEYWTVIDRQQHPTSAPLTPCLPPRSFSEGLAWIMPHCDGKIGFVDYNGKEVIPARYDSANHFSEGLASVQVGNKWGAINKSGALEIAPTFDELGSFSSGLAPAVQGSKYGYIDRSGKWAFSIALTVPNGVPPLKLMREFNGDLAAVFVIVQLPKAHLAMEYIDRAGRVVYGPTPFS